jgi:hypothetical protein
VRLANEHFLVFDKVIEVLPHWSLRSRAKFQTLGWAPEEVEVLFSNRLFDAAPILRRIPWTQFDPPNGRKFSLVDRSLGATDTGLSLSIKETDYFTIRSVLSGLTFELRTEFGSLDPRNNRIPHSLCLHFIARCGDGKVLCMLNDDRKAYGSSMWSVSAEEQFSEVDLDSVHPIKALFRRALLEEVFGLRDKNIPLDARWSRVEASVRSMRVWSLFVEEQIANFTLLGVCQLNIDSDALRMFLVSLVEEGSAGRDLEGRLYLLNDQELRELLVTGESMAAGLFSGESATLRTENLHWTTRYRIFRLLRALDAAPLNPHDVGHRATKAINRNREN